VCAQGRGDGTVLLASDWTWTYDTAISGRLLCPLDRSSNRTEPSTPTPTTSLVAVCKSESLRPWLFLAPEGNKGKTCLSQHAHVSRTLTFALALALALALVLVGLKQRCPSCSPSLHHRPKWLTLDLRPHLPSPSLLPLHQEQPQNHKTMEARNSLRRAPPAGPAPPPPPPPPPVTGAGRWHIWPC
jgi:hypothetical protein